MKPPGFLSFIVGNSRLFQSKFRKKPSFRELFFPQSEIAKNETVTDYLLSSGKNAYFLKIPDFFENSEDFRFFIRFKSLSGSKKTLFLSIDKEIEEISQAQFKSTFFANFHEEEDIMIEKKTLKSMGLEGKTVFFYVIGEIKGLYRFSLI